MNNILKLQKELDRAKKELEILTWGLTKTNESIKILYKDLARKNKELQEAKEKLTILASHDSLTGLLSRRTFNEILEKFIVSIQYNNKQTALLFLDLDNFKMVNDKFGHQTGDSLLNDISKRLQRIVKQKDICARYGGDEFAILLVDIPDLLTVEQIAKRIIKSIRKPFYINDNIINTSISIGIALLSPDISDYKSLYSMADIAMYKAKQNGRDCYQLYSEDFAIK